MSVRLAATTLNAIGRGSASLEESLIKLWSHDVAVIDSETSFNSNLFRVVACGHDKAAINAVNYESGASAINVNIIVTANSGIESRLNDVGLPASSTSAPSRTGSSRSHSLDGTDGALIINSDEMLFAGDRFRLFIGKGRALFHKEKLHAKIRLAAIIRATQQNHELGTVISSYSIIIIAKSWSYGKSV